jgi:hypothetical protein
MTEKKCGRCGRVYPATTEYFYRRNARTERLNSACKACCRKVAQTNRDHATPEQREAQRAYLRKSYAKRSARMDTNLERRLNLLKAIYRKHGLSLPEKSE